MRKYCIVLILLAVFPFFIACMPNKAVQTAAVAIDIEETVLEVAVASVVAEDVVEAEAIEVIEFQPIPVYEGDALPVSSFREIWGYVIDGREDAMRRNLPVSDIGYFGAGVSTYGQLVGVPDRRKLANYPGRVHLVVVCEGRALSYFTLMEGGAVRQKLITDLIEATKPFDGLQIDFENVPERARASFHSFLAELRAGLGSDKMFTIAIAARTRTLENDVYDYAKISPMVDRMLIMAYDEHWSGSRPGPIASMNWGRNVATYALRVIGPDKLIMGLPFYGRSWADRSVAQAYVYNTVERIKREEHITDVRRENGIPSFTYTTPITATVFYEDDISIATRLEIYSNMGVQAVGFWRIGQESPTVWNHMKLTPR